MNTKKASLTLEVVVIAALVLLVLIVLSIIFGSRLGLFNRGLKHCDTICKATTDECKEEGYEIPVLLGNCEDDKGNKFTDIAYCCKEKKS